MPLQMDSCQQYIQTQAFISGSWGQYAFNGKTGWVAFGSYLCTKMKCYLPGGGSCFCERKTVWREQTHQVQEL